MLLMQSASSFKDIFLLVYRRIDNSQDLNLLLSGFDIATIIRNDLTFVYLFSI